MRSQDNSKLNISVQIKENSFIKGRKLDSYSNTPLVINSREHPQYGNIIKQEENDMMLGNLINRSTKAKTKKKKKKKTLNIKISAPVTKASYEKLEKPPKPKKAINTSMNKPQKQKKVHTSPLFNWGVNQERLKNYILNEQMKQRNVQETMLKRVNKTDVDIKQRRDQLGVSFLNNVSMDKFLKKKKLNKSMTPTKKDQNKPKIQINQEEIRKYKEFKQKMNMIAKQEQKKKQYEKQFKIHQNLQNLNEYIRSRNRSLSVGDTKQRRKNRTASTYGIIYEDQKENLISDRYEQKKKRKVLCQFKNQSDKSKLVQSSNHESMRQPCSSIYQYMSNSSSANIPNESDPEQDFANFDNSFYSQKLITLGEDKDEMLSSQRDWDEQDIKEIQEIRSIEQAASKYSEKRQKSQTDEQAAIKIQKVWRKYKTRQILSYYQDYFKKEEEQEEFNLNDLHQSQIQELIKMGYIKIDSKGKVQLIEQKVSERSSNSSVQNKKKKPNPSKEEAPQTQKQMFDVTYHDYIEGFSDSNESEGKKTTEKKQFLSAISEQQEMENCRESTEKNSLIMNQQITFKKKKRLSIDVDEIEKEYQNQQQVEIGEIRCAIGSESLIKSLSQEDQTFNQEKSIFEQSSFQDFVQVKFKELMARDKMDELISMREKVLEERHKQQIKTINEAYQNKQISPKTYDQQNRKLEKWVTKQRKDLEKKKTEIIKGQQSTYETVMKTQRDILFMKQMSQSNSQSYIKIIDSFSQDSVLYSEQSLRNSIIDIQNQNFQQLQLSLPQKSSLLSDEDLSKSQNFDDEVIFKNNSSPSHQQYADYEPEPFNLHQLAQSQVLRVQDIVREQSSMSEKQAESYSILISNMLIVQEIQLLCQELGRHNIDIFELVTKAQINRPPSQLQTNYGTNQTRGFKTGIPSVKIYLTHLTEFMLCNYKDEVLAKINVPLGPSSKDMLRFLHPISDSTIGSDEESNSNENYLQNIIMTSELFGTFERFLMNEQILKSQSSQLLELEHFHNKAIFDALNEALDYHRPYGMAGQPYAWKSDAVRLQFRKKSLQDMPNIIKSSSDKVLEWCHYLAGFLIDKEDCPYPKILMFDQECLAQIKEDRMIRMLSAEVIENEDKWISYDEEHTVVAIDLSDMIFDHLLEELLQEIH
ncbi:unnamed protein product (macronuclear) [Paramecium tetraurelia]|uniref:Uncharacterized protein n=1 Tax=Paramecium tetraurelia TaxID=5888 RepID=A0BYD3_PARTE|nr:uncharacterized protein GSPATT00033403001 [Paramecium tetraurelia]CAK63550.1 unnamed protein product [Paramecium tetraurelia]|eukprot:XP_001430948.1 hypothetical protein (macronuclear) [Paramecium tetraurelia strain d4-2]